MAVRKQGPKAGRAAPKKDPRGGLTAAGRAFYRRTEGARLRPGVTGPADTPEKQKRKGSFLRRHFANPRGPMVDDNGEPTRLALSARAWGEPVPKSARAAQALARKGAKLLEAYAASKEGSAGRRAARGAGLAAGRATRAGAAKSTRRAATTKTAPRTKAGEHAAKKTTPRAKPSGRAAKKAPPRAKAQVRTAAKASPRTKSGARLAKKALPRAKAGGAARKTTSARAAKKAPPRATAGGASDPYTRPALRERLKRRVQAGAKGGRPGQWSARKAQLLAAEYEKAGGGYRRGRTKSQKSLHAWTEQR